MNNSTILLTSQRIRAICSLTSQHMDFNPVKNQHLKLIEIVNRQSARGIYYPELRIKSILQSEAINNKYDLIQN